MRLSRRDFLATSGLMMGVMAAGKLFEGKAWAYSYGSEFEYAELDPDEVAWEAYRHYFKKWCCSTVLEGLVSQLRKTVGGPWNDFPVDAYRWAHGGLAGWGALCGTMVGAGIVIGLVTKDTDTAEAMVNDIAFFYSYTPLPKYEPRKILKAEIQNMSVAGTPVCHISVGRWMAAEGVAFLTDERAERCARLSADIARQAALYLNEWLRNGKKYKPRNRVLYNLLHNGITSQNNCMDCHGQNVPNPEETYATLKK